MAINAYSIQLITTLLDGTTTQLPSPGSAETGVVGEAFGGLPMKIAGDATDQNIKLGMLSDPKWLAVYGDRGVSVKIAENGTAIPANPMMFVCDTDDELGISEIWVTNSQPDEKSITILAVE